jgi:hypothetical protein
MPVISQLAEYPLDPCVGSCHGALTEWLHYERVDLRPSTHDPGPHLRVSVPQP